MNINEIALTIGIRKLHFFVFKDSILDNPKLKATNEIIIKAI
jgi:hypothetical protein